MVRSFRHKGLRDLQATGKSAKIRPDMQARCRRILDLLDKAPAPEAMDLPGFHFHKLQGSPTRYSVRVTANYRITFEWHGGGAVHIDLEDYH